MQNTYFCPKKQSMKWYLVVKVKNALFLYIYICISDDGQYLMSQVQRENIVIWEPLVSNEHN